jgi:hypothetical protein
MRLGMGLGLGNLLSGQPLTGFPNDFSFNFDGSNDYLDCGNPTALQITGQISISCWIKTSDKSANQNIVSKDDNTNRNFLLQTMSSSGVCRLALFSGNSIIFVDTAVDVCDGNWHHILATFTPSTSLKIYLDGSLSGTNTTSVPSSIDNDDVGLNIGRKNNSDLYFDGLIDEVAIWDVALDANTIAKLGSKPLDLTKYSASNLKLWLRAGDKAEPESNTSIARQDFYTDFDGTDDYVNVADDTSIQIAGDMTITGWINPTGTTSHRPLVYKRDAGGTNYQFYMSDDSTPKLKFFDGSTATASSGSLTKDRWQHIAITIDSGVTDGSIFYIDGVASGTATFTISGDDADLLIGKHVTDGTYYEGDISSVGIYQTALDAQTIKQMAKSRFTPMRDNRFSVVDFDGSNDYIAISNNSALSFGTNAHTISAWAKLDVLANFKTIISKRQAGGTATDYNLSVGANGVVYTYNGSTTAQTSTGVISAGSWFHYALVYSGSAYQLYINGSAVAWASGTSTSGASNSHDIGIGWDRSGNYWDGAISSVSLYNVEKSAEEVYAIYQQGITYDESSLSGLVGLWRMGDDTSKAFPTIADSSSNSNNGTITNGASDDIVQQMVAGYDMGAFESTGEETTTVINRDFSGVAHGSEPTDLSYIYAYGSPGEKVIDNERLKIVDSNNTGVYWNESGLTSSKLYKITIDATGDVGNDGVYSGTISFTLSNGTFTAYKTGITTTGAIYLRANNNSSGTTYYDNLKVKEVLQSADLSDTYPAIIDVNEPVLGVEVASNNFGGWTLNGWTDNGDETASANNSSGGNQDLTISYSFTASTFYKITATFSNISGNFYFSMDGTGGLDKTITTNGEQILYVKTASGGASSFFIRSSNGSSATISNVSIKSVEGNVGTMTNQDSADLVYSSVLPDQSFLTGNSSYGFGSFDGTNDIVTASAVNTDYKSISLWIKPSNTFTPSSSAKTLLGFGSWSYNNTTLGSATSSFTGELITLTDNDGSTKQTAWIPTGGETIPNDSWTHLAFVWDGSKYIIYYNGQPQTVTANSVGHYPLSTNNNIRIATGGTLNTSFFDGDITGVAFWNKSLTDAQILSIYNNGRHSNLYTDFSDNLITYLAFGNSDATSGVEDTSSTIYDRSGSSNHGTVSGTTLQSPPNAQPEGYAKQDVNRSTTTP